MRAWLPFDLLFASDAVSLIAVSNLDVAALSASFGLLSEAIG